MKPQYSLHKCMSSVIYYTNNKDISESINKFTDAKTIVWYYDTIRFMDIKNGNWNESLRDLSEVVKIRIFNVNEELYIWQNNGNLKGRLRTDGLGNETDYFDSNQLLNGTKYESKEDKIIVKEDKGIEYHLPYNDIKLTNSEGERIIINVRNYIDYSDIGQAGIVDTRFINLLSKKFKQD